MSFLDQSFKRCIPSLLSEDFHLDQWHESPSLSFSVEAVWHLRQDCSISFTPVDFAMIDRFLARLRRTASSQMMLISRFNYLSTFFSLLLKFSAS